jgi:Holliday junction DNA helicase RuvA
MIGWIHGEVLARDPAAGLVLLDVRGVGYELRVSLQTLADVPEPEDALSLWVHTHVREDQLALYGFSTAEERSMFRLLTSVPKVGPKNALATLGGMALANLVACISEGDAKTLTKTPGIGKRTAEQIVLTLRDKLEGLKLALGDPDLSPDDPAPEVDPESPLAHEAQAMLISLGWKSKAVEKSLASVLEDAAPDTALDEVVRRTLAKLMER